ncbi:potassium transporter TrkA [Kiloniella litopenaei]|uniref:Potassium transporter TrkA n=1 Tax=Kiloniella litopenaei TaxID=1549748 RepID=A0A0M2R5X4_9PROT|nr:SLC13 family permease [Kiloniella litopenaei]KKJ75390.1 potassium transporter TrkA [Kiloniella litopenaei]
MTTEQSFLFALFGSVFIFLIWGKIRYDLVAFGALVIAVIAGFVTPDDAFAGFGHPAVVIIALVLIVSRGLINSGAVELISGLVLSSDRPLPFHIGIMSVVGAALSAIINNVAALALLMSLDLEAAEKAKRAAALSLMPLSFATILGGMITLIGTPPNIVIAQYRERVLGESFNMFDFAPVGLCVAFAGIVFVALIGWRLIPTRDRPGTIRSADDTDLFVAEAQVPEDSKSIGSRVRDLYTLAGEHDITVLGLVRRGRRLPGFARYEEIRVGDHLVLEGDPKSIESFLGLAQLDFAGKDKHDVGLTSSSLKLTEVIVPDGARIEGKSSNSLKLLSRHGVTLLGVSRQGKRFRERVRKLTIQSGDMLLLLGPEDRLTEVTKWLGVLPLAEKQHSIIQRKKASMTIGLFLGAIALSVAGLVYLPVALAGCVIAFAALGIVSGREVYESVEWKVIVLLASLIPLGIALENSGGTKLIAELIVAQTSGWPHWAILTVLIIVTMTLSDFLNNVATALIAAPIGLDVANAIGASPDPFLMGVAVAASCAFLTPIGHKNNTIIMGPGGYRFGDYWRMGLPLEILVVMISVPAILFFWPL